LFLSAIEREVTLRAYTEGYKSEFDIPSTFKKVYDDVTITIKGDIELEPSHKVLYYDLDNAFDIDIKRGSGEFAVNVNDSSVIKFSYDRANQRITVYPLSIGYAQIVVEDQKLISSQKAYCNIIVATAARIELVSESILLQEEDTTKMTIRIYDSNGDAFTQEQMRFMRVHLELDADTDMKSSGIRISCSPDSFNEFFVKGLRRGEYELVASAVVIRGRGHGDVQTHKIFSNRVELHVFEKLEARPASLLLAPGCLAAVEIVGGPSQKSKIINNVYLESRVTSEKYIDIKTTDQSVFSVKAKSEGETDIIFEVKFRDGRVIGSVHVKAKVALVNGVEILGMLDRQVHVGAQIRLIALTRLNNEYFTHAICPFHYYWVSKNDGVLQIDSAPIPSIPCHDQDSGDTAPLDLTNYNIAVNATALATGFADIELRVTTKYPAPYYSNYDHHTTARVQIIDHLVHDIPTYIGKAPATPALLLLPPNTDYQLRPHPDGRYRYSLCTQKQLSGLYLSETGLISTSNEKGKATVLVEDTQIDNQVMMINLAVSNIYSIFIENSYKVSSTKHFF